MPISFESRVLESVRIAPDGVRLRLAVPESSSYRAGQFAHLRIDPARTWPLLRRPFSAWDAGPGWVDVLYAIKGSGTRLLSERRPGEAIGVLGPLGNWFAPPDPGARILYVAGGVGIVPFYLFSKQILERDPAADLTLLFGARTKSALYGLDDLSKLPLKIEVATDDGSAGRRGLVTTLLEDWLGRPGPKPVVYGCGPDPMLRALHRLAVGSGWKCEMSLETRMGCALGACRACVTAVKDGADWRYSRVCLEGPNYSAEELFFSE